MERKEGQQVANVLKAERKLIALLVMCTAVAIDGAAATRMAEASMTAAQSVPGMIVVEEDGSGKVPRDQGTDRSPDIKGDATREKPSTSEDRGRNEPAPSWQIPAPGCPYVDRPLDLIV